jgi:hypothetical protein
VLEPTPAIFDIPAGWRYEPGDDGVGVLAAADAFADRMPIEFGEGAADQALAAADRLLDAGNPATALLGLKNTFAAMPTCYFTDLKPLWAQAYRDLGRAQLADRLDSMATMYAGLGCHCPTPHLR